jgi:hypothetical protein
MVTTDSPPPPLSCPTQDHDLIGAGKFEAMWRGPYIVKRVLEKRAYELVDYDGIPLSEPRNGFYLKQYYG